MVVDGEQVSSVLLGQHGAADGAHPGLICVDMSTIGPTHARHIAAGLAERDVAMLDAPVTGSSPRAEDGTLTIMCGGEELPAELARRERLRGDREPGLALAQHERVHAHGRYDLECDTTHASPLDCALSIKAFLACASDRNEPRAFDELRAAEGWNTGR